MNDGSGVPQGDRVLGLDIPTGAPLVAGEWGARSDQSVDAALRQVAGVHRLRIVGQQTDRLGQLGLRTPLPDDRYPPVVGEHRTGQRIGTDGVDRVGDIIAGLRRTRDAPLGHSSRPRPQLRQRPRRPTRMQGGQGSRRTRHGHGQRTVERDGLETLRAIELRSAAVGSVAAAVDRPHPAVGFAHHSERVTADATLPWQGQPGGRRRGKRRVDGIAARGQHLQPGRAGERMAGGHHAARRDGRWSALPVDHACRALRRRGPSGGSAGSIPTKISPSRSSHG